MKISRHAKVSIWLFIVFGVHLMAVADNVDRPLASMIFTLGGVLLSTGVAMLIHVAAKK